MRRASLAIALGLAALAFPAAAGARAIHVRPGHSIQAAVNAAKPGDRVVVHPGTYSEPGRPCPSQPLQECAVVIGKDDISLVGRGAASDVVLRSRSGQHRGIAVGRTGDDDCLSKPDKLVTRSRIAHLTVRGFADDGVLLFCVERWRVSHVRTVGNDEYGIFPSHTRRGRLDHSFASGANDTGIYIGQSRTARVDHNKAVHNVSGFEIENSIGVVLEHNNSRANTAGILVFALPGLSIKRSDDNVVRHNVATANNRPNSCGDQEDIVCGVPSGTGLLVLAADDNRVSDNRVTNNRSLGIAVADFCVVRGLTAEECAALDIDPTPDRNDVVGNRVTGNGGDPDLNALPSPVFAVDLAWDTTGEGNCWSDNVHGTSFPGTLPDCP